MEIISCGGADGFENMGRDRPHSPSIPLLDLVRHSVMLIGLTTIPTAIRRSLNVPLLHSWRVRVSRLERVALLNAFPLLGFFNVLSNFERTCFEGQSWTVSPAIFLQYKHTSVNISHVCDCLNL